MLSAICTCQSRGKCAGRPSVLYKLGTDIDNYLERNGSVHQPIFHQLLHGQQQEQDVLVVEVVHILSSTCPSNGVYCRDSVLGSSL
jgi:hypothetical protein